MSDKSVEERVIRVFADFKKVPPEEITMDTTFDGADATKAAYLAKQYADKAVMFVTDSAVQTLGGYGFIREFPAERWLRNARGFTTFHGMAIV